MKKVISVIAIMLSVLVVLSSASFGSVGAAISKGDANKDGNFNEVDVLWMRKMLIKEIATNTYADVNENSIVDSDDVRQTRRVLAELQKGFEKGDEPVSTVTTTSKAPDWVPPADNGANGAAPFYEGGVPKNYYNQLASVSAGSSYIEDGLNRGYHTVAVNQMGYTVGKDKVAKLIEGRDSNSVSNIDRVTVYLVDEETKMVKATFKTGMRSFFPERLYGEDYVWYSNIDMSSFDEPGTYRLYTPVGYSLPFEISKTPYSKVNDEILMGLYYQRCGGAIEDSVLRKYDQYLADTYGETAGEYYAKYSAYAREACHLVSKNNNIGKEVVVVDKYDAATDKFVANTDENGDVVRLPATDFAYGLHDAGDYGRYTQPAAQVVADLLYTYELAPEAFTLDVIQDPNGEGKLDTLPDILDHARWEAKFLLNMQNKDKTSSSYGGFYFKICTGTFASAQYARPENDYAFNGTKSGDHGGLRVMSVNFADTAGCVGALASCAYTFKDLDPEFAEECRVAAELGYDFYNNNRTSSPRNMTVAEKTARDVSPSTKVAAGWQVGGGAYGGSSTEAVDSQFYMYGALYRINGSEAVHSKLKAGTPGVNLSGQSHGGFGTLAYILTAKNKDQNTDEELYNKCVNAMTSKAASNITSTATTEFGNLNKSYGWGSNPAWANGLKCNTICEILGLSNAKHIDTLRTNFNFLLGINAEGWCFVTGQTEGSSKNIHHYPSVIIKKSGVPCAPGLVAAGYSKESSYGSGWATDAGKFRYRDDEGDHVTNEICIYWNSSITFAYSAIIREDVLAAQAN